MVCILLVDDMDDIREITALHLQERGFEVEEARNGQEALEKAAIHLPDVVVSDILMPTMDGFTLCQKWRDHLDFKSIPFVFYSGTYTDPQDQKLALQLGGSRYILKPADPEDLARILTKIIQEEKLTPSDLPSSGFENHLRQYNSALIRKLEDKMIQVEEAHEFTRTVLHHLREFILILDDREKIVWANRAFMEFFCPDIESLESQSFREVQPLLWREGGLGKRVEIFWNQPESFDFEMTYSPPEGEKKIFFVRGDKLECKKQGPRLILSGEEITRRKLLEKQWILSQKLEALGKLSATISHDFNNILTAISGNADVIKLHLREDQNGYAEAQDIVEIANRATCLTRQLLFFGKGEMETKHPIYLSDILQKMERLFPLLLKNRIQLCYEIAPDQYPVEGIPIQLEQVVLNLVLNAQEAMPAGGTITLKVESLFRESSLGDLPPGPWTVLTVEDEGVGFPEQEMDRVLDAFFTTKESGTGMGLYLVSSVVDQMNGHLKIHSPPQKGSQVKIHLPGIEKDLSSEKGLRKKIAKKKILLVEDEPSILRILKIMLEGKGYEVTTAPSGKEALSRGRNMGDFDLLLTDVMLPDIKGTQVASQLRSEFPTLKVLYISGYASNLIDPRELEEKKAYFLAKPFTSQQLNGMLEEIFRSSKTNL